MAPCLWLCTVTAVRVVVEVKHPAFYQDLEFVAVVLLLYLLQNRVGRFFFYRHFWLKTAQRFCSTELLPRSSWIRSTCCCRHRRQIYTHKPTHTRRFRPVWHRTRRLLRSDRHNKPSGPESMSNSISRATLTFNHGEAGKG